MAELPGQRPARRLTQPGVERNRLCFRDWLTMRDECLRGRLQPHLQRWISFQCGVHRPDRSAVAVVAAIVALACSTQRSDLISPPVDLGSPGNTATTEELIGDAAATIEAVVNERPIGGATLLDGTTGGGIWANALAEGRVVVAQSSSDFLNAISGDTPTVILIKEGQYDFTLSPGRAAQACRLSKSSRGAR